MRQSYRTDLSDEQWELLEDLVSVAKPGGRPRRVDIREIVNAIVLSCDWRNGLASTTPRLSEMEIGAR
jgi:transposase